MVTEMKIASTLALLSIMCGTTAVQPLPQQAKMSEQETVSFKSETATPMEVVVAVAMQTHIPMGLFIGRNPHLLCEQRRPVDIHELPPGDALRIALAPDRFSVDEQQGVWQIMAPDLTPWQRGVLAHSFNQYPPQASATMNDLMAQLNGWMLMEAEGSKGYAGSTLSSTDSPRFSLPTLYGATVQEIGDRIAALDNGAVWIFKVRSDPQDHHNDELKIYSYREDVDSIAKMTSCD